METISFVVNSHKENELKPVRVILEALILGL